MLSNIRCQTSGVAVSTFITTLAMFGSTVPARAATYDIDCKLILCLPAGFPSGCSDALRRMVDRLRDGKPPIGFCAMSDGTEMQTDVAWRGLPATRETGWTCPAGKHLYHNMAYDEEAGAEIVITFCYDTRIPAGIDWRTGLPRYYYTGKSIPERTDLAVRLTVSPGMPGEWSSGVRKIDAGFISDARFRIRHDE